MQLSKRLFWDVDIEEVNLETHARFIVERTLNRGELKDWRLIREVYGWDRIKKEALKNQKHG